MKHITIIPARYGSTRFPGKPLVSLINKPIIQYVYENAQKCSENVFVATDDERILNAVKQLGGKAIMTSKDHQSGTDRCAEAAETLQKDFYFDVVINIQGDEPFVRTEQIVSLIKCFEDEKTDIATLIKKIDSPEVLFNPNRPKVTIDNQQNALLFSRATIPYLRGKETEDWLSSHDFYNHLGMYAYRTDVLAEITKLHPSKLELAESLEQLRWLENGYRIKTAITEFESIGIDTPEDLKVAEEFLKTQS